MSKIDKLSLRGIRSFPQNTDTKIEFFKPLTLIQGHNGSGKTTIIESLKMATTGSFPPLSQNGRTFIQDPSLTNENEVKSSIKLKFTTPKAKEILVVKNFQMTVKQMKGVKVKSEFKRTEQLIKSFNSKGELVTVNSTCENIDKQIPFLMHASKAILDNVIFCHQEDMNWPFSESGTLKKVFDEIFDTAKYTKSLEEMKEIEKKFNCKAKEIKHKTEIVKGEYENYNRIKSSFELSKGKYEEIRKDIDDLRMLLEKKEVEYEKYEEIEEKLIKNKTQIEMLLQSKKDKEETMKLIKSNVEFEDKTSTVEEYNSYIQTRKSVFQIENQRLERINQCKEEYLRKKEEYDLVRNTYVINKNQLEIMKVKEDNANDKRRRIDECLSRVRIYKVYDLNLESRKGMEVDQVEVINTWRFHKNIRIDHGLHLDVNVILTVNEVSLIENKDLSVVLLINEDFYASQLKELNKKKEDFEQKLKLTSNEIQIFKKIVDEKQKSAINSISEKETFLSKMKIDDCEKREIEKLTLMIEELMLSVASLNIKLNSQENEEKELNIKLSKLYKNDYLNEEHYKNLLVKDTYHIKLNEFLKNNTQNSEILNLNVINTVKSYIDYLSNVEIMINSYLNQISNETSACLSHLKTYVNSQRKEGIFIEDILSKLSHDSLLVDWKLLESKEKISQINVEIEVKEKEINKILVEIEEFQDRLCEIRLKNELCGEKKELILKEYSYLNIGKYLKSEEKPLFAMNISQVNEKYENYKEESQEEEIKSDKFRLENEKEAMKNEIFKCSFEINEAKMFINDLNQSSKCNICDSKIEIEANKTCIIHKKESLILEKSHFLLGLTKKLQEITDVHWVLSQSETSLFQITRLKKEISIKTSQILKLEEEIRRFRSERNEYNEEILKNQEILKEFQRFQRENDLKTLINDFYMKITEIEKRLYEIFHIKNLINMEISYENSNSNDSITDNIIHNTYNTYNTYKIPNEITRILNQNNVNTSKSILVYLHSLVNQRQNQVSLFFNNEKQIKDNLSLLSTNKNQTLTEINQINSKIRRLEQEKEEKIKLFSGDLNGIVKEMDMKVRRFLSEKEEVEVKYNELLNRQDTLTKDYNDYIVSVSNIQKELTFSLEEIRQSRTRLEYLNDEIDHELNSKSKKIINKQCLIEEISSMEIVLTQKETELNSLSYLIDDLERSNRSKGRLTKDERNYTDNMTLMQIKSEINQISLKINELNKEIHENSKKNIEKDVISSQINRLKTDYSMKLGQKMEIGLSLSKYEKEMKNPMYLSIESKYNKSKLEYIMCLETVRIIEEYYESLDRTLLKYHNRRMEEVNKLINYYWTMTYNGKDIKNIEIKSDVEKTGRSRSYNYRIIMYNSMKDNENQDSEVDMRGRCSAGQKVLASIIIRLALAETFCSNCGILCLDEPTTNLDEGHVKSLAKSLREIIQARQEDNNFQLIVITHDPMFVELIGSDYCDSFWYVSKGRSGFSEIESRGISMIYSN